MCVSSLEGARACSGHCKAPARYQLMKFYAMAHDISLPLVFLSMPICSGGLLIVCIEEGVF